MKTDTGIALEKSESIPFGKVMGVVKTRDQLSAVSQALVKLGANKIEVEDGAAGIEVLEAELDVVAKCVMGEMEAKTVQSYYEAARNGLIVFAATIDSDKALQAAEAAKALGATEVAHFGSLVITNY